MGHEGEVERMPCGMGSGRAFVSAIMIDDASSIKVTDSAAAVGPIRPEEHHDA
jgi:streptogramin lyase